MTDDPDKHDREGVDDIEGEVTKRKDEGDSCWAARYTFALLTFLGLSIEYSLRVNLSIAIVAMVGTSVHNSSANDSENVCPLPGNSSAAIQNVTEGEFTWDETAQGLVLGAFFYGYTSTNLLGGRVAEYLGGKIVFGVGAVASALVTLLSPLCARTSTGLFVAARVLLGVVQGVSLPAINSMMATWFPPEERAKFGPIVYGGMQFGIVVSLSVSGWLIASGFLGGWPSVFYVFGALGVLWGVPWFLLVHDRPEKHPRISRKELAFIQANRDKVKGAETVSIPWKSIVSSGPMWACVVIMLGSSFGFHTLLTELPTYLANVQHFDMNSSGVFSALPYASLWLVGLAWGFVMERISARGLISIRSVRRISTAVATYVPAVGLVTMCFVNCNASFALATLCVCVGITGAAYSGNALTEQDIAPNLTGTLVGISNSFASISGFLAPATVGAITKGKQTSLSAWRLVFSITAVVYAVAGTLYLLLMSSEVQPWNDPKKVDKESKRNREAEVEGDKRNGEMVK